MTSLKVIINSENSAFDCGFEAARILRELADRIENTQHGGSSLKDGNGNVCGYWSLAIDLEDY